MNDILSLFLEGEEKIPVMNYIFSTRVEDNEAIELDITRHHELVFLFLNYEKMKKKFIAEFETQIRKKVAPSGHNLPKDNITVSVFFLNNDTLTIAQIKDRLRGNKDLLGIYIFDFGEECMQSTRQIKELELCPGFTLRDLLSDVNYEEQKIMLGLFSQRVQDIIFRYNSMLEDFMEQPCSQNIATLILPASKNPVKQEIMLELAGIIEFLKHIFNSPDCYRKAIISAQKEIKERMVDGFKDTIENQEIVYEKTAQACTIFLGYEHQKFNFHGSRETSYHIAMRHIHKTLLLQIDETIQNIEDDEGEYAFDECDKIAKHISQFTFCSLHGLNVLVQYLGDDEKLQRFKKLIFSIVMALQSDFFRDSERTELFEREIIDNWTRFNTENGANLIGKDIYSRLNKQSTEIAFMRGVEYSLGDIIESRKTKGSSLIFQSLCPDHSSSETLVELKKFLQNNSGNSIPRIHQWIITPILYLLETEILNNLLAIYFQCRDVTHSPPLAQQMPINVSYGFLFWSKDRMVLNRDKLQTSLSKVNEKVLKLERKDFHYRDVPVGVTGDPLDWFEGVKS